MVALDSIGKTGKGTDFVSSDGKLNIMYVEKDFVSIRFRVKNCAEYQAVNITFSFLFEKDATNFDSELAKNQLIKEGYITYTDIDCLKINDDEGKVKKLDKGIMLHISSIEPGDHINFPITNLNLKKEKIWIAVRVRNHLYYFLICKKMIESNNTIK